MRSNRLLMALGCLLIVFGPFPSGSAQAASKSPNAVVVNLAGKSPPAVLAAREIQRYVYLRTGTVLPIAETLPPQPDLILLNVNQALDQEHYSLKTTGEGGRKILTIAGGSDLAVLYGAYEFVEKLGVRFHLHGDTIPDGQIPFALPDLDEMRTPVFVTRGIQPFHDFTEGPDWWSLDDYKAYFAQMAKMRMNLFGLHCYPEGGVGPEPLVWIGLPEDVNDDGTVKFSYPSRWASTSGGAWGYAPTKTSEFAAGASLLFASEDYGAPVTDGFRPLPRTPEECNAVFNRAGRFLGDALSFGKTLGIRTCLGTETPLHIPQAVLARLKEKRLDPKDPATARQLYTGMFKRIAKTHPLDYYWLWTPEGWTWGGNQPEQLKSTLADIDAALGALNDLGRPFTLATCGWVLGPQQDRAALDKHLPPDSPMSCINRQVGFSFVEPAFARIEDRPQWAIPWMEDDPNMVGAQLWVGRTRRDAADAHAYGCTGFLGIHWRTRVLAPNFATLAQASWNQQPWNPNFGERLQVETRQTDVRLGGSTAAYLNNAIAGTELDPVYQTCRYGLNGYRIKVPNGRYDVTVQLCEVHYDAKGKRVFGMTLQGKQVAEHLDVFDRVGKNVALDLRFRNIAVNDETLALDFTPEVEFPFVAGIAISGQTAGANQLASKPFTRQINCGGAAWHDFEADLPSAEDMPITGNRSRDLACDDFYADWAQTEFGPEVAEPLAKLFTRLDGGQGDYSNDKNLTHLPRPSDWLAGPGGIKPNATPWATEQSRYAFVDEMASFRPRISGAGNRARFDYWLNTFRFHRSLGQIGCARGELDAIMKRLEKETNGGRRKEIANQEAVPIRRELARQWETMMMHLLQAVSTPGELGTIANLEQHSRRNPNHPHFLELHDAKLAEWIGSPLPRDTLPSLAYHGPDRIIVPTIRSVIREDESLKLTVMVLSKTQPKTATLNWRRLGETDYRKVNLSHVARAVHTVGLPATGKDSLEYFLRAEMPDGQLLHWPASAPGQAQTVVMIPVAK